jgi:hypothetical protein
MAYVLSFDQKTNYSDSKPGIALAVSLTWGGETASFEAAVDTGATYCVFERAHGETLGLDIESGMRCSFGTATGSFIAYGHEVLLSALDLNLQTTVYFAEGDYFTRNVLGRRGWLDRVRLALDDYSSELYLSRLE